MSYNVLYYGQTPNCQGPNNIYHNYLKIILDYSNPDLVGLVKMGAIKRTPTDPAGNAPYGFADSILKNVFNPLFPNRFDYCPFTNNALADNIAVLYYDKQKLGYVGRILNYTNVTDFNLYKFYYRKSVSGSNNDSVFLYVLLGHTQSGNDETVRLQQINGCIQALKQKFSHLPNLINMGDFNFHSSNEQCYGNYISPSDTNFRFFDPPFAPDYLLQYPADWTNNPNLYSSYLTTSTRQYSNAPNNCGTDGGAKSWYDHMLISSTLVLGNKNIKYLPHTYKTIGNDGNRVGISVNTTNPINNSVPVNVANALFQMSNKYPVIADFEISLPLTIYADIAPTKSVELIGFNQNVIVFKFDKNIIGKSFKFKLFQIDGSLLLEKTIFIDNETMTINISRLTGNYYLLNWNLDNNSGYFKISVE